MSKKLITVLVTVFTVMLLTTGCNSDKKAVTETVEGFLNAMVANDMEKASQYATEEFMESNTMKLMQPDYLADTFYATMNIDKEDLDEAAQNAVPGSLSGTIRMLPPAYLMIRPIWSMSIRLSITTNWSLFSRKKARRQ